jgi:hypothetical protein
VAGRFVDITAEENEAADALPDELFHAFPIGRITELQPVDPRHDHLRDIFLQRPFFHGRIFAFSTLHCKLFLPVARSFSS